MTIKQLIEQYKDEIIQTRRTIHANPEVRNEEFETTQLIKDRMAEYGIEVHDIGMKTGVVAVLRGAKPGKTIAIREDIDALPMPELTGLPFASKNEGKAHACGHDIHTTCLIYTAKVLSQLKDQICGNVMFIFQPAEEGGHGAHQMVEHGIFDFMKPDMFIGLHVSHAIPVGTVGVIRGVASASSDEFKIIVTGKGGHGAHPERFVDPVAISAYLITQLQTVVARENYPVAPAVLTIGSIHGGNAANVVPDSVEMLGTLRNLSPDTRDSNKAAIERICSSCAQAMRGSAVVQWKNSGIPVRVHSDEAIELVVKAATDSIGADKINYGKFPSLGSEDFAEFFPKFGPGCQFSLGTMNDDENTHFGIHNSKNVFDEGCLPVGIEVLCQAALEFLK